MPTSKTWQDVINATIAVAARADADWNEWFTDAGVWRFFNNALRRQPYSGPPVAEWSTLAAELRQEIASLLERDSNEIVCITRQAQLDKENRDKAKAAQKRRQRGSIVGIHGAPGMAAPPPRTWDVWTSYLTQMGVKWYKQCDNGDPNDTGYHSIFAWTKHLKQNGIDPIIRYLVPQQFPNSLPKRYFDKMRLYATEGILWAEIGNEPNLDIEWQCDWHNQPGHTPLRHDNPEVIRHIADTWVKDARAALAAGVKPAFYAFAPTDWRGGSHPWYSSVFFTRKVVDYLAQHWRPETIDIFRRGGWIAVHASTYEQPCDFDPFGQGGVVWDMTLRSYEVVLKALRDRFGNDLNVDNLVVMSTEGGVFTRDSTSMEGHIRLSTEEEHAHIVVGMFRWLENHSPLQAMCPWCLSVGNLIGHYDDRFKYDGWIEEVNAQLRPRAVFEALRQLRFDHEREDAEAAALESVKLDVPYISQWDETAMTHRADCGPTCMAMILNAGKPPSQYSTVDRLYQLYLPEKAPGDFTTRPNLLEIGQGEGLAMEKKEFSNREAALKELHTLIKQNQPFVALINYAKWKDVTGINYASGHFVVVTGFDGDNVYVHDPLFRGPNRSQGAHFIWRNAKFLDGWGSGHELGNPDFAVVVPSKQVARLCSGSG